MSGMQDERRGPVVWAINPQPHHNLASAERFGPVRAIFDEREGAPPGPRASPFATARTLRRLWDAAEAAQPDDYFLPCGNSVVCLMASCVWMEHFQRLRLLIYGAQEGDYELRDIPVEQLVREAPQWAEDGRP